MNESERVPSLPPVDPVAASHVPSSSLTPELLASLLADGDDELAAWAIEHALDEAPRAAVFDGLVAAAMRLVGQRWASGEWSVADEHWASQTLVRALDRVRPDVGPEGRIGPLAVVAAPAGELHAIGLVCLEQCLREAGWQVANLGPDTPAEDLARFVRERAPQCVALTASHADRLPSTVATIAAVREASPDQRTPVLLGGSLAARPGIASTLDVDWAGTRIADALAFAASISPEASAAG
jgi:methanogenic corrinoid protein MtbC1